MFEGNNSVREEEYYQGKDGWSGPQSKSYLGEVQKGYWERSETQSVEDDSSSQMSEITNSLRQTVSLKSKRTSQHHLESSQSEIPIHSKDCAIRTYVCA